MAVRVRSLRPWLRRAALAWLALEFGAGILALCLLVAVLPAIDCLLAFPPDWSWKAALGASANGSVGAAVLGRRALAITAELFRA